MRTAVTGATGFVGSHLVEALLARGDTVACLVRSPAKAVELGLDARCRLVPGALEDESSLRALADGADVLFHVAGAVTAPASDEGLLSRVNREGTERVAQAAKEAGVRRLVYVSSLAASGPSRRGMPHGDASVARPVNAYGRSKLEGEAAVRASGAPFTILRPPAVYGPRDRQFLTAFRLAQRPWMPVLGDGLQELSLIHGRDLAEALIAAAESARAEGHTYHAAHAETVTQRALFQAMGRALGRSVRILPLPRPIPWILFYGVGGLAELLGHRLVFRPSKAAEFLAPAWTCDSAPLREATGWTARIPLEDGLAETARWYREVGRLPR